jgi:5-methylcytosine-specific restriction protein A
MTELRTFFTPREAAEFLRYSYATLAIWRSEAVGPAYIKIGHSIRYRREDLEQWAAGGESNRLMIAQMAKCHMDQRNKTKRLRGRTGMLQRKRRLAAEPLCRDCLEAGITRKSEEVDHIIALADGGSDADENIRCLCSNCHAARTKERLQLRLQEEAELIER